MSAVMYNYRVTRGKFWDVASQIRQFYRENSMLGKLLKRRDEAWLAVEVSTTPDFGDFNKAADAVRWWFNHHSVTLQVFEYGRDYILRVLEQGYEFMNHHQQFADLRPCFYDDRSDMNPNDRRNGKILDRVDAMIDQHRYFTYTIYDDSSILDMFYMRLPQRGESHVVPTP